MSLKQLAIVVLVSVWRVYDGSTDEPVVGKYATEKRGLCYPRREAETCVATNNRLQEEKCR